MSRPQAVTIVISRDGRGNAGDHSGFEDALADALLERGAGALVVPHLYHLRASHPAAAALSSLTGDLVVASWLHPRAALWTLRALGVGAHTIRCLNLADFASVADCARALAGKSAGDDAAVVKEIAETASPRWYPVIDYSRCTSCRKCVDFCLFGVYALSDGKVLVTNPDNCKNGCPACARTCPQRAIIFPHYFAEAGIAGGETTSKSEASQPEPGSDARGGNAPPDDLEHLITALEKLDE
jgi:NAD-dependent dihydropyrimidine dehydrogenase PreA subunit